MPSGRVRWFDAKKGFGFITNDEGEDVFLPAAALPDGVTTLRKGARVEFSVIDGRKGPQVVTSIILFYKNGIIKSLNHFFSCNQLLFIIFFKCFISI